MDAFLILLVLLMISTLAFSAYASTPTTDIYATTKDQIEMLLDPPSSDEQTKLLSRALPNRRLIPAFDIQSTFVSDDVNLHRLFVKDTKQLVQRWSNDWSRFAESANFIVEKYITSFRKDCHGSAALPFDSFVQAVTLAVVLISFFETDANLLNFDDVVFVAKRINERWRDSKCKRLSRDGLDEINDRLRQWVPKACRNPLDYIIPSYETMWRVVAITVAEEYWTPTSHATCETFLRNPNFDAFTRGRGDDSSIQAIIQESLRLHPPTRHISRAIEIQPRALRIVLGIIGVRYRSRGVADVASFQRSSSWGKNPDVFDPSRHTSEAVKNNPDAVLFAFGYGSTQCVARRLAPHAAGILFAAIMHGVAPSGSCVICNDGGSVGGREGWERWRIKMSTTK